MDPNKFVSYLVEEFRRYVALKLGSNNRIPCFYDVERACNAAQRLAVDYDLGIGLATSGLSLEFIFGLHGLPTKTIKLERRGRGAIWQPIDSLTDESIQDKRLILFDNDAITGRTLRRAVRELSRLAPRYIDLLLVYKSTPLMPNTLLNVPEEIRKKMTLSQFECNEEGLIKLEGILRGIKC